MSRPKLNQKPKPSEAFKKSTMGSILRFAVLEYFPRSNNSALEELCRSFMGHCKTPEAVEKAVTHFLEAEKPHVPTAFEVKQWAYNELISKPHSDRVAILRRETAGDPCKICEGDGQYTKEGYVKVIDPETGEKTKSRKMSWVAYCPCRIGQALAEARRPRGVAR